MEGNQFDRLIQVLLKIIGALGTGSTTSNVDITANTAGIATDANIDALETVLAGLLTTIRGNVADKLKRIKGASNYTADITYIGATTDVSTITHTGTTELGVETLLATYTYDGSNRLTDIVYS